jgi:MFS family permease
MKSPQGSAARRRLAALLVDVGPLRDSPPFRRLWIGSTLSSMGTAFTIFAVPLQVFDLTRSPLAVGAIGVMQMVPTLLIGLFGGALADAIDRRRLVLLTSACQALVSALLAAQAFAGLRAIWLLYLLVAVQAGISATGAPVRRTFIPSLLSPEQLSAGLALNRLSFQLMLIAGPSLAGVIAAVHGLGLRTCYLIDALSFTASLYGVGRLPSLAGGAPSRPGLLAVGEGMAFIRRTGPLLGAFLVDLNATVFGLPVALFPAINAERFGGDPATLGLFSAAIGVGGLVSAGLSGPLNRIRRQGWAMLVSVAVWGAAFAGFAVVPGLWPTLSLLALAGAADTVTVVFRGTIVQAVTPDRLRGRVTAAEYIVGASGGQIGNLESGALGSVTTPVISALTGGLVTIAAALVIGLGLPEFARYRSRLAETAGEPRSEAASDGSSA